MNSVDLCTLKNHIDCSYLDEDIVQFIVNIMVKSNIKPNKVTKKQVNVMKTNTIQAKKDLNENKIIMIMNKISGNNITMLTTEYLINILVETEEKYNVIQDEIFNKIIKDIKFIDNYIKFALNIFMIEKHRLNLTPERFIENIISNINNNDENIRIKIYELVRKLINCTFFNVTLIDYISDIVLNNTISDHYIDTYYWFNGLEIFFDKYIDRINDIIVLCGNNNMNREKILIESLIDKIPIKINCEDDIEIIEHNNKINNIVEEYLKNENVENILNHVQIECKNIDDKNNFAKNVFLNFVNTFNTKLFNMLENLIKEKILFKSNLSKGLLILLEDMDINKEAIVNILKFLKNQNITNNIENIFKKYKVKMYYDD